MKRRQFKMPAMSNVSASAGPSQPAVARSCVSFPGPQEAAPAYRSCSIRDSYDDPSAYQTDCTRAVEEELSLRFALTQPFLTPNPDAYSVPDDAAWQRWWVCWEPLSCPIICPFSESLTLSHTDYQPKNVTRAEAPVIGRCRLGEVARRFHGVLEEAGGGKPRSLVQAMRKAGVMYYDDCDLQYFQERPDWDKPECFYLVLKTDRESSASYRYPHTFLLQVGHYLPAFVPQSYQGFSVVAVQAWEDSG